MTTGERFEHAVRIMHRLRARGGCPWDREQTFDSITKYTVEETYEVLEAIEKRDWQELPGELGDLLLQVLFYAEMANEAGHFSIDQVLETLSDKLVRRHPHVFGEIEAETSQQVLKNWEAIKRQERAAKSGKGTANSAELHRDAQAEGGESPMEPPLLLESVSSAMPALMEACKLSHKAAHVGFDWPAIDGLFDKLREETVELQREVERIPPPGPHPSTPTAGALGTPSQPSGAGRIPDEQLVSQELHARLQDEVGDLLFTVVNLARYLAVDPERALRHTNRKFRRRFGHVERGLRERGKALGEATLEEMERHWRESKGSE